jgi:hypothetical protein
MIYAFYINFLGSGQKMTRNLDATYTEDNILEEGLEVQPKAMLVSPSFLIKGDPRHIFYIVGQTIESLADANNEIKKMLHDEHGKQIVPFSPDRIVNRELAENSIPIYLDADCAVDDFARVYGEHHRKLPHYEG